jgi:hypothetical protein
MRIVSRSPASRRALHNSIHHPSDRLRGSAALSPFARAPSPWRCAIGAWLRLDQFGTQVLIDDEWHVVPPGDAEHAGAMLLDFGYADYGIPLGLLAWSRRGPWVVRKRCCAADARVRPREPPPVRRLRGAPVSARDGRRLAWLLATSPLLVIYSRMARPYAITLLLGWIAHVAFHRYWSGAHNASTRRWRAARPARARCTSGVAALATWMHPIVAPFVLAPLAWAAFDALRADASGRRKGIVRLAGIAAPTAVVIAALVLPPLLAHPISMTLKSGVDSPNVDTLVGALHAWLGHAVDGGRRRLRRAGRRSARATSARALPEARTGVLGIALTFAAIVVSRPAWSSSAISVARYCCRSCRCCFSPSPPVPSRSASRIGATSLPRRVLAGAVALAPCAALAMQSPWPTCCARPNGQTLHLVHHFDFRPGAMRTFHTSTKIPLSPFWTSLAARPRDSLRSPQRHSISRATTGTRRAGSACRAARWCPASHRACASRAVRRDAGRDGLPLPQCRSACRRRAPRARSRRLRRLAEAVRSPFRAREHSTVGVATAHCEPSLREPLRTAVVRGPRARRSSAARAAAHGHDAPR